MKNQPGIQRNRFISVAQGGSFFILASGIILFFQPIIVNAKSQPENSLINVPAAFIHLASSPKLNIEELNTINTFEKAAKSVVYITNTALRRDLWSLNTFEVPQGSGSGFIWNSKGHIVTNFHVIYGADSIQVVLDDQSTHDARVIGVDPDHDLA